MSLYFLFIQGILMHLFLLIFIKVFFPHIINNLIVANNRTEGFFELTLKNFIAKLILFHFE